MAKTNLSTLKAGIGITGNLARKKDDLFEDTSNLIQNEPLKTTPLVVTSKQDEASKEVKQDLHSARVTLPMSREQKRFIDQLSASLQGDSPQELINRNTLLRAMIRLLQESKIPQETKANTEDELLMILKNIFKL